MGDVLLFTPLTVHGSNKNHSTHRRRSVVMQAQSLNSPPRNEEIYKKEINFRSNFVLKTLEIKKYF